MGLRKIAVDAMGGDNAPGMNVEGAIQTIRALPGTYELYLVGDEQLIRSEINKFGGKNLPLIPVHAPEVITMAESPTEALRKKPQSSIAVTIRLVQEKVVEGAVSAGNTGAFFASALLILGKIEGIKRPSIGTFTPGKNKVGFLLDVGANPNCKPLHLFQFGIMGSIFLELMRGVKNPSIGLLSIGEEEGKGNELVIEAYKLFKESQFNFYGNIEGRDILSGTTDIVVCDGFVGNIVLKHTESMIGILKKKVLEKMGYNPFAWIGAGLMSPVLKKIKKEFDYQEYGGVPLLGVNGTVIICHGSSSPKAIMRAIMEADRMITKKINDQIQESISLKYETHVE